MYIYVHIYMCVYVCVYIYIYILSPAYEINNRYMPDDCNIIVLVVVNFHHRKKKYWLDGAKKQFSMSINHFCKQTGIKNMKS